MLKAVLKQLITAMARTVTLEDVVSDVEYLWVVDGERENLLDNDPFVHTVRR